MGNFAAMGATDVTRGGCFLCWSGLAQLLVLFTCLLWNAQIGLQAVKNLSDRLRERGLRYIHDLASCNRVRFCEVQVILIAMQFWRSTFPRWQRIIVTLFRLWHHKVPSTSFEFIQRNLSNGKTIFQQSDRFPNKVEWKRPLTFGDCSCVPVVRCGGKTGCWSAGLRDLADRGHRKPTN